MTTLCDLVQRCYERYASSRAIFAADRWLSFAELEELTARLVSSLADLGVGAGDRVVVAVENRPELVAIDHALFTSGTVRVALSPRLHASEVAAIADDCQAKVLVCEPALSQALGWEQRTGVSRRPAIVTTAPAPGAVATLDELASCHQGKFETAPPAPEEPAAIMYTSGSTGKPKGAVVTHRGWVGMVQALWAELPPIGPEDVVVHVAPMSHFSGSVGSAYTLHGAGTVALSQFRPHDVLEAIRRHHATAVPLVPTMLKDLVAAAESSSCDLRSLRALPYGGAAISPTALERAYQVFGEVLYQFYGLAEALVPLTALSAREHRVEQPGLLPERLVSAGRPTPKVALRIVDGSGRRLKPGEVGEIQVQGEVVTPGYWDRPRETAEAFVGSWFKTGDLGTFDADGYLRILDRIRDVIVTGGFTVHAAEVEQAIESLDAVAEVAVVGAPSERWGEAITAVIVPKPGNNVSAEDIVRVCRSRLASYKQPRRVEFVTSLPRTSTGKINRRAVREPFWRGRARSIGE